MLAQGLSQPLWFRSRRVWGLGDERHVKDCDDLSISEREREKGGGGGGGWLCRELLSFTILTPFVRNVQSEEPEVEGSWAEK